MAKRKSKQIQAGKPKDWLASQKQVKQWLEQAGEQILRQDFAGAAETCRRVLRYVPVKAQARGEALEHLATAYSMLRQFEESYHTLSQALEINPHLAHLWYNRAVSGRYTMRLVQAMYDLEKAVELETQSPLREKYQVLLAETRYMVEAERAMRGPDFSLDQLQEQQDLFQQGLQFMQRGEWDKSERVLRRVIDLGDCLPQPQGNLALTLLMQQKYDEAEAALKRALEIDPNYDLAKYNLEALPSFRRTGQTPKVAIRDPMANAEVSLTFLDGE